MFTLIVSILILTPNNSIVETYQISGFKSENSCKREAASFRVKSVRSEDFKVIFDNCIRVN